MQRRLVAVALSLVLVAGCGVGRTGERRDDVPHPISAAEVEANAKVRLPAETVLLSTSYVAFQDWHLTAMFRLPAAALPGFLSDSRFPAPTPELRPVTNQDHAKSDTWKPDAVVTVSGVDQTQEPVEGVFRKVLFDLDRENEVTVYLVAFTT